MDPVRPADFRVAHAGGPAKVRVMRVFPGYVHTQEEEVEFKPADGALEADPGRDLAKVAVFYRHEAKEGLTGTKAFGFTTGLTLKPRVAFGSTGAHDWHNLMVIGNADEEMAVGANKPTRLGGGPGGAP